MKQLYKIILTTCLLLPYNVALGQTVRPPKVEFHPSDSVPFTLSRVTNFNPSVSLSDTVLTIIADSLRTDGTATIFTVYETDADSIIGLWQVGSGSNCALWLNSQRVSYDDFSVTYRNSNEHGVVVHSMLYQYPVLDSSYSGHDTLFLGREGSTVGEKNLCAIFYYPGRLDLQFKRQLESALAIRYGAVLHGPYVNSLSDTLWNPLSDDSLFSVGICGIGRDDSLSLFQPRSAIRNDIMTLESVTPLSDLEHIMLGCDSNAIDLSDETFIVDTVSYLAVARQWKLRALTYGHTSTVRLTVGLPLPFDAIRLMLTTVDGSTTVIATDSTMAFTLNIADGQDYFLSLLVNPSALSSVTKGAKNGTNKEEYTDNEELPIFNSQFSISPNPSSGHYTLRVNQPNDDIINIRVVDANGRIVEQHSTAEPLSQYTYNGHLSANGVYYVTVTSNGRQQTIKLIVVR